MQITISLYLKQLHNNVNKLHNYPIMTSVSQMNCTFLRVYTLYEFP